MRRIPKIIHQIWSGDIIDPYLDSCRKTWTRHHPDWEYILWDDENMNNFILEYYPHYSPAFASFRYNIQRLDAIRYLILDKIGGVYVDLDTQCFKPLDQLLEGKKCCFSLEPEEQQKMYPTELFFNNAFMASIPGHPFMKEVIEYTFAYNPTDRYAGNVLETTGPLMLVNIYLNHAKKEDIYLIPPEYTSPLTKEENRQLLNGDNLAGLIPKLKEAYCNHFFLNSWLSQI